MDSEEVNTLNTVSGLLHTQRLDYCDLWLSATDPAAREQLWHRAQAAHDVLVSVCNSLGLDGEELDRVLWRAPQ